MGPFTRDMVLAHTSSGVEPQPAIPSVQNLSGRLALISPNGYHGQRTRELFELILVLAI